MSLALTMMIVPRHKCGETYNLDRTKRRFITSENKMLSIPIWYCSKCDIFSVLDEEFKTLDGVDEFLDKKGEDYVKKYYDCFDREIKELNPGMDL